MPVKKNEEYIVDIIDNGFQGEGIAKVDNFTIFIPNAIKGEKVKKDEEMAKIKGENVNIDFGSQIRNYVLEPYKQVKDLRSGYATSNVFKVLDGDILDIMKSVLLERV